jgi:hypothetical protein
VSTLLHSFAIAKWGALIQLIKPSGYKGRPICITQEGNGQDAIPIKQQYCSALVSSSSDEF